MDKKKLFQDNVTNKRSLVDYLFHLQIKSNDVAEFADSMQGKDICLVGGGESQLLRDMHANGIRPNSLTNIDPYAREVDDGTIHVKQDYLDTKDKDKYDKILAVFSLPGYCQTVEQLKTFYKTSILALKPGGSLHVAPINSRYHFGTDGKVICEPSDEYLQESRKFANDLAKNFPEVSVREIAAEIKHPEAPVNLFIKMPDEKSKAAINDYLNENCK